MIYMTGDTHCPFDISKLKPHHFPEGQTLTKEDYVIICGDFGAVWDDMLPDLFWRDWLDSQPWTTLFVDGNHENFDLLDDYPVSYWHGGKVHFIKDSVIHLMRGQIYTIDGQTFFTFGGAASHDIPGGALDRNDPEFEIKLKERRRDWIPYRIIGESWWPQELPTEQELQTGLDNLAKADFTVDYVITHCCATDLQTAIVHYLNKPSKADVLTDYFQALEGKLHYKHWYFGHYHYYLQADEKHTVLYNDIIKLE